MSSEKHTITVEVLDITAQEWKMPVPEFLSWIQEEIADIPEEFHSTAVITATEHDIGEYDATIKITISYTRQETDDELNKRIANEQFWKEDRIKRERAEYERLKAKYEP